jgi:uroporphyrin-III C-methyltransferase/precorrin-2 dehydrogenase/sirohydrochlorin ferrochelatase
MDYLPAFHDIRGKLCLVVGGGEVGTRKAGVLLAAGARVRVVAPEIEPALAQLSGVEPVPARFDPLHLDDAVLVIAATNDRAVNREISELAQARRLPVNVVDDPELCSFIMPAIVDRAPLMIAFSSGGGSPVLTRRLRSLLETMIPQNYGRLAAFAVRFRDLVKAGVSNPPKRRLFWEAALDGPVAERVLAGDEAGGEALLRQMLASEDNILRGEIYLVGAGPGDPELLTFRALRLLQKADVVVYDKLVAPAIVAMCRRDAERICLGRAGSEPAARHREINELLVRRAREGQRVCRLKGGDPYVFGSGDEELAGLAALGIPFQVVPGITAASGLASYAGIPLTQRDLAQSCRFVDGHPRNGQLALDWPALARPGQTLVVYMGLNGLATLCRELVAHGLPDSTPAAIVSQATTPAQRVLAGTLASLPGIAERERPRAPTLIVVGQVVVLREQLAWFTPQQAT